MTNQIKIYFDEEKSLSKMLSDIMVKNNLGETFSEASQKLISGKTSKLEILYKLTTDMGRHNISQTDFINSLQTQLSLTKDVAQKVSQDISLSILPLFKLDTETEEKNVLPKYNLIKESAPTLDQNQKIVKADIPPKKIPQKKVKQLDNISATNKAEESKNNSGEPDKYRETI